MGKTYANETEARAALDKKMDHIRELLGEAESIADQFGITIQSPLTTLGYTQDVWYEPKGHEGDGWSSSDNWESSTTGGWISSSASC